MMLPTVITAGMTLLLLAAGDLAAGRAADPGQTEPPAAAVAEPTSLSPGPTVHAKDAFPSPAMFEQFAAYLAWTKAQGLSRLAVFESLERGEGPRSSDQPAQPQLPTVAMQAQFDAYLAWTRAQGLSPFHAFKVTDFD
jgi:hypothetical protein